MSSIYQDKKTGGWIYQWRPIPGGGIRRKRLGSGVRTRKEAERVQAVWDQKMTAQRLGLAPVRCPVGQSLEEYLAGKAVSVKPLSLVNYRAIAARIRAFLEGAGVPSWGKLTSEHAAAYVAHRQKEGAAPKSIGDELSFLRSVLNWLLKERRIGEIPVRTWPKLRAVPARPDRLGHYTAEELAALKDHLAGHPFEAVFLAAIYTGARREELRAAKVGDVRGPMLLLRNLKTGRSAEDAARPVAIHPDLRKVIAPRIRAGNPDDLLFPEMKSHSRNWPHVQLQRACQGLGIPYRRFHGLRHTFATFLLAGGEDLRQVMAAMGHTQLDTTQRYLHAARALADVRKLGY